MDETNYNVNIFGQLQVSGLVNTVSQSSNLSVFNSQMNLNIQSINGNASGFAQKMEPFSVLTV